jgi:hypothetical protein
MNTEAQEIQELLDGISRLSGEIARLSDERDELVDKWALAVFPHKVGDAIVTQQGKRGRIISFYSTLDDDNRPAVLVNYKPLRKDGSDSAWNLRFFNWKPNA